MGKMADSQEGTSHYLMVFMKHPETALRIPMSQPQKLWQGISEGCLSREQACPLLL